MNKKVSIVVPIYKVEKYLNKCIDSIINQTYKNIEILLIDDESPDSSPKICEEYKKIDNRIQVIHKINGGLSDARNVGLNHASGEYVLLIDGDDFIAKDMVEYLVKLICDYNADISSCGYYNYFPDTNSTTINNCFKKEYILEMTRDEALKTMVNSQIGMGVKACIKLYRRELFNNISYPVGKIYEDVGTTYKLILKSKKIVYSSIPKYYYTQNPTSITKTEHFSPKELNRIEMVDRMCNEIEETINNFETINCIEVYRCSQYVAVVNVMIKSNHYDKGIIKMTRKILLSNFKNILKIASIKQKTQFILLMISFSLYKIVYKIKE